jgi:hypothetical protein
MSKVLKEMSSGAGGAIQGTPNQNPLINKKQTSSNIGKSAQDSSVNTFDQNKNKTASELPQGKDSDATEDLSEADSEALQRKNEDEQMKKMKEVVSDMISESVYKDDLQRLYFTKKIAKSLILKEFNDSTFFNSNSSGINLLLRTMKSVQPKVKEFYMILTSNRDQREVFRSSLISRIKKFIDLLDLDTEKASEFVKSMKSKGQKPDTKPNGAIFSDQEIASGKRKVQNIEKDIEPDEFDGQDLTGYNLAKEAFKYIHSTIENDYLLMANKSDKMAYIQYLIIHLYHHMESWEEEIRKTL